MAFIQSTAQNTLGAWPDTRTSTEGASTYQSLSEALNARRIEYTRVHRTRIKIGSWNVGALSGTDKDLAGWFVHGKGIDEDLSLLKEANEEEPGGSKVESVADQEERRTKSEPTLPKGDNIGLYVLGLQEVIDISSPTEALRPFSDPSVSAKWKRALLEALPPGYTVVAEQVRNSPW